MFRSHKKRKVNGFQLLHVFVAQKISTHNCMYFMTVLSTVVYMTVLYYLYSQLLLEPTDTYFPISNNIDQSALTVSNDCIRILFTGDVMLARGIDYFQSKLRNRIPVDASWIKYHKLAKKVNGKFDSDITKYNSEYDENSYIWGNSIDLIHKYQPNVKIINFEAAITNYTKSDESKKIVYKCNPKNCLSSIDYLRWSAGLSPQNNDPDNLLITLANNHILDWNKQGLLDTIEHLQSNQFHFTGIGYNADNAWKPAIHVENILFGTNSDDDHGYDNIRVYTIMIGVAMKSSLVPKRWISDPSVKGMIAFIDDQSSDDWINPGIDLINEVFVNTIESIDDDCNKNGSGNINIDCVFIRILSVHWGGNWDFSIDKKQIEFAHKLIDLNMIDVIHGHSSHHVKAIELYKSKLIIYGCGDFIDDYEGIKSHAQFHKYLSFVYFVDLDISNKTYIKVDDIILEPTRIKHFQVTQSLTKQHMEWLVNQIKYLSWQRNTKLYQWYDQTLHLKPQRNDDVIE